MEAIKSILERYNRFDDGLILSFEYFYIPKTPLSARVVLYARNNLSTENKWGKVEIVVKNVFDLNAKISGNQSNSICFGVSVIKFDSLWCVDIDGNYPMAEPPRSLAEVRRYGACYIIGGEIEACEIK